MRMLSWPLSVLKFMTVEVFINNTSLDKAVRGGRHTRGQTHSFTHIRPHTDEPNSHILKTSPWSPPITIAPTWPPLLHRGPHWRCSERRRLLRPCCSSPSQKQHMFVSISAHKTGSVHISLTRETRCRSRKHPQAVHSLMEETLMEENSSSVCWTQL